ncbi:MAG: sigma-70 family RNA polymerase sigma factor [Planctomycetes bacterium]|nr:sigma-70 family RNA polymerase sigma factor [Planctomycetota bacterium]
MAHALLDADVIRAAVSRHERALILYAARILGGDADRARDVVQEVFMRLCDQKAGTVEDHLVAWLYRACRSRALDVRRKESRMRPLAEDAMSKASAPTPEPGDSLAYREDLQAVVRAAAALPERQQEALRLKFHSGLKYHEIAKVMGVSVPMAGHLIHTGIATLRTRLSREAASDATPAVDARAVVAVAGATP